MTNNPFIQIVATKKIDLKGGNKSALFIKSDILFVQLTENVTAGSLAVF